MKDLYGKDIVALAAALALQIGECADPEELTAYIELFGLLRHNLEVIRGKCHIKKIEYRERRFEGEDCFEENEHNERGSGKEDRGHDRGHDEE